MFRRIHHANLPWKSKHLLAGCVEYYLELDSHEWKEFEDMLAERENEDIQYFRSRRTIRLEEAAKQEDDAAFVFFQDFDRVVEDYNYERQQDSKGGERLQHHLFLFRLIRSGTRHRRDQLRVRVVVQLAA